MISMGSRKSLGAAAVGVGLILWAGLGLAGARPATAKAGLAQAKAAAARWHEDAVLVTLSALRAAADGTAPPDVSGWVYTFYSVKAKAWAGFHAGAQGLERVDLPAGLTRPLPASFADSDAVLAEARKHGLQPQGEVLLSLMPQRDANLEPGVYWCAAGKADLSADSGMRGYCVDPATAKFVARMAGGAIAKPPAAPPAATARPEEKAGGGEVLAGLDPADCGGFTTADAAGILDVPAGRLTRRVEKVHGSLWSCSFAAKDGGKQVVFSIELAKTAAEAAADMEQYRSHLGDNYSDLMGLGGEGIWTEVNRTVTYRKQNVTIQVQQPPEKIQQLKVVKAFFDKN